MNARQRAERRAKALELHLAGASYQQIADGLGFASKSSAHDAVKQALAERTEDRAYSEAVTLELARLDALFAGHWAKARRGDVASSKLIMQISERRTELLAAAAQEKAATAAPPADPLDELKARRDTKRAG
jgi:hypothetical protein